MAHKGARNWGIAVSSLDLSSICTCPRTSRFCIGPRTHHVNGSLGRPSVKRVPQRLAVDCHDLPLTALAERVGLGEQTLHAFVRIKTGEHLVKRSVRRKAVGHVEHLLEPLP